MNFSFVQLIIGNLDHLHQLGIFNENHLKWENRISQNKFNSIHTVVHLINWIYSIINFFFTYLNSVYRIEIGNNNHQTKNANFRLNLLVGILCAFIGIFI